MCITGVGGRGASRIIQLLMLDMVYHIQPVEATNEVHVENISVECKNVQM